MKPKHFLLFCALLFISSCSPSKEFFEEKFSETNGQLSNIDEKLEEVDSNVKESNSQLGEVVNKIDSLNVVNPGAELKPILGGKYLKCYIIHTSLVNNFKSGLLGVYVDTTDEFVPAFSANIPHTYKEDDILYIVLEGSSEQIKIKEIITTKPLISKMVGKGLPYIEELQDMENFLVDMEGVFHSGSLSNNGFHKKRHIILERIHSSDLKVFKPQVTNSNNQPEEYYSYSFNNLQISIGDTLFENYELDTVASRVYLRTIDSDHYPHPPKY